MYVHANVDVIKKRSTISHKLGSDAQMVEDNYTYFSPIPILDNIHCNGCLQYNTQCFSFI